MKALQIRFGELHVHVLDQFLHPRHPEIYVLSNVDPATGTDAQRAQSPPVVHPLVRTHPQTGRKILYLSRHVSHIEAMAAPDSGTLIESLLRTTGHP
jgi:alpha-ketoglutarate-dependent taurine dioxygenase